MNMLVKVDPYIMYGYPSLKAVKELVYKRGCAKIDGQRVPITDNDMIEKALGEVTKVRISSNSTPPSLSQPRPSQTLTPPHVHAYVSIADYAA